MREYTRADVDEHFGYVKELTEMAVPIYLFVMQIGPQCRQIGYDLEPVIRRLQTDGDQLYAREKFFCACLDDSFEESIRRANAETLIPMPLRGLGSSPEDSFHETAYDLLWRFAYRVGWLCQQMSLDGPYLARLRPILDLYHWSTFTKLNFNEMASRLEIERIRTIDWLEGDTTTTNIAANSLKTPGDSADSTKIKSPQSQNVNEFIQFLKRKKPRKGQETAAAREFCEKHGLPESKAAGLIRGARRYPDLW